MRINHLLIRPRLSSLHIFQEIGSDEEVDGDDDDEPDPAVEGEALDGDLGVAREFREPVEEGGHCWRGLRYQVWVRIGVGQDVRWVEEER